MKKRIVTTLLMFVMSIVPVTVALAALDTDREKVLEDQIVKTLITMKGCHDIRFVEKSNEIRKGMELSTDDYTENGITQPLCTFCWDTSTTNVEN